MQKVYNSLKEIEEVVKELLPPRLNKYIGCFKLSFYLSSTVWDTEMHSIFTDNNKVTLVGERDIQYTITKATLTTEIAYLQSIIDPYSGHSDDHGYWKAQQGVKNKIEELKKLL